MPDPGSRLKRARKEAGYDTASDAARAMGVNIFTYTQHESGLRGIPRDAAIKYANFYRIRLEWLLTAKGETGSAVQTPVVGYIGGGAEFFPVDDHPKGEGIELVPPPPGVLAPCVAARVRGDSMYPMLEDGWLVFWTRDHDGVTDDCINRLCVVQLKDGPTLVKRLRRGSKPGRWTLESHNAPSRLDVLLEWAAPVLDIRPA